MQGYRQNPLSVKFSPKKPPHVMLPTHFLLCITFFNLTKPPVCNVHAFKSLLKKALMIRLFLGGKHAWVGKFVLLNANNCKTLH